jgi:hypothetical protein
MAMANREQNYHTNKTSEKAVTVSGRAPALANAEVSCKSQFQPHTSKSQNKITHCDFILQTLKKLLKKSI